MRASRALTPNCASRSSRSCYDQDLATPIRLFARDEAGNASHASLDYKAFPKPFSKGRIELNDAFLQRVVPDILEHAPELRLAVAPGESYLPAFLRMNSDLRRLNAEKIVELSKQTAAGALWKGPFLALGNAKVESKFAAYRTYFYGGRRSIGRCTWGSTSRSRR